MSDGSETERNRKNVTRLLEALGSGKVIEQFRSLYDENVVMSENGTEDPNRVGLEKNLAYETFFMNNSEWHGAKVGPILVDGPNTAYQMWMDLSFQGQRMQRTQVALQTWKDDKIIREVFFYSA
jgi:hypothetical protein